MSGRFGVLGEGGATQTADLKTGFSGQLSPDNLRISLGSRV